MAKRFHIPVLTLTALIGAAISAQSFGHGSVIPQAVDTTGLTPLGKEWRDSDPYKKGTKDWKLAVKIGASAYNQNCARCHGLEAISGGIAPDLRMLDPGVDGDDWFKYRVTHGAVRDGKVYMPKMADYLSQEALWAIRTWLVTQHVEQ